MVNSLTAGTHSLGSARPRPDTALDSLTRMVERVEAENRVLRLVVVCSICLLLTAPSSAGAAEDVASPIRTRRLEVIDESGSTVALLTPTEFGVSLLFFDRSGSVRANIGYDKAPAMPDGSSFLLFTGPGQEARVSLLCGYASIPAPDGSARFATYITGLAVNDSDGNPMIEVTGSESPQGVWSRWVNLYNKLGGVTDSLPAPRQFSIFGGK